MPAGKEMDALVAKSIMGGGIVGRSNHPEEEYWSFDTKYAVELPEFSTDISAAWKVVEKMNNGLWLENHGVIWMAKFPFKDNGYWMVSGNTAPLAICRAALLAVMEKE